MRFASLYRAFQTTSSRKVGRNGRRPRLERLESRCVLSFIGSEHLISNQANDNFQSDNASNPGGGGQSVAVWINTFSSTDHDVWAQRFDKYDNPVGPQISVDFSGADSFDPHVSMGSNGFFVVSWTNFTSSGRNVVFRLFNSAGNPVTGVNSVTTSNADDFSDVAMNSTSFVISWTHQFSSSDFDILGERFTYTGSGVTPQGIFGVNTDTNIEDNSNVAMSPGGVFDIVYERDFSSTDTDILMSQYKNNGAFLRSLSIDSSTSNDTLPDVGMDNKGNAVVVYQHQFSSSDNDIYARRVSTAGAVSGINFVNTDTINETAPHVAVASGGALNSNRYVVTYDTPNGVEVTEMSNGTLAFPVATLGPVTGFNPSISIDGFNRYFVTYTRNNGGNTDIFGRRDLLS
jgi:hypothetical protein